MAAEKSSEKIFALFQNFMKECDFVGADMARKFLQRGYTRSRRYGNHKSGKKDDDPVPDDKKGQGGALGRGRDELPRTAEDPEKAESARIFYARWQEAPHDPDYEALREALKARYWSVTITL